MAVFNREDGQLALGSKTPVSILQEILQKKGSTPHYELIFNGVGTPDPLFKFRVSAEGMTAIGDGKSKKEAKHDAAASLLKRLLTNKEETEATESKEEVDIASPYTGALKVNYVGWLEEICVVNKIPFANYVLVGEEGPPHARVFTMRCDLGCVSEIAVARTKKQGKHLVAQKMIERISKVLKDRFILSLENTEAPEEVVSDQEKIRNGSFHHDLTIKAKDLHNVFHIQKDEQPIPRIFLALPEKPEDFYESMEKPLEFLEEVVEALEGVVKKNYISEQDLEKSFSNLVAYFEDESEHWSENEVGDDESGNWSENGEEDKFETQGEPSELNGGNIYNILPDFLHADEEDLADVDNLKRAEIDNLKQDDVDNLKQAEIDNLKQDDVDNLKQTDPVEEGVFKTSDNIVYSSIKVETPRGLWDFIGQGSSEEEALNQAARDALKFLRMMAIPPSENLL